MNKYYILKLNNCYDSINNYISSNPISIAPNIIEKNVKDLSLIDSMFLSLDDSIIKLSDNLYKVSGSFPIIGIEKNNQIYDLITGKIIKESLNINEVNGLSYSKKIPLNEKILNKFLLLLRETEINKYISYLNLIEGNSKAAFFGAKQKNNYYLLYLKNTRIDNNIVISKKIDNNYIELVTKEKIIKYNNDIITKRLNYYKKINISDEDCLLFQAKIISSGISNYIDSINNAKINTISSYNNYKISQSKTKKLVK